MLSFSPDQYNEIFLNPYHNNGSAINSKGIRSHNFSRHNNSINANTIRAKMMIDDMMDPITIMKLKNLDEERLSQIDTTLQNIVGALLDIKNHLGYGF